MQNEFEQRVTQAKLFLELLTNSRKRDRAAGGVARAKSFLELLTSMDLSDIGLAITVSRH